MSDKSFGHYRTCSAWMALGYDCQCHRLDRVHPSSDHAFRPPFKERARHFFRRPGGAWGTGEQGSSE